jgi:hypothetical protein
MASQTGAGVGATVRRLLLVALAVFLVTVAIGMINGLDLYDFNRDQLLTHVHSGTLGWITLALVAATMWVNRRAEPRIALALMVLIPIYVLAFYTGNLAFRAVSGGVLLLAILWLLAWVWSVTDRGSLPSVGIALGLTSFALGAIVGVLIQIQLASGTNVFPKGADQIGAHAATMVFSYLILVVMGILEWQVLGTRGLPRGGAIQLGGLFLGGLVIMLTFLFAADQAQKVLGIYLLLQLIATVLFAVRVLPKAVSVDWMAAGAARQFAASAVFVIVAVGLLVYLIFRFMTASDPTDASALPVGVLTASDHAAFIGVVTNTVFALIGVVTRARSSRGDVLGQIGFWAMNVGLAIFLVGLSVESPEIKRIGAPLMGTGILVLMAMSAMRLTAASSVGDPEAATAAA